MHRSLRITVGLLLLLQLPALALARAQGPATRVITGKVTDAENGQGLPSVAVLIKGTQLGTHTGDDGTFSLPTGPGALTLSFRRIGYLQADRPVTADEKTVDVALKHDVLKLNETIVTGQATGVTRENAANAVATVNAEEISHVQAQTTEQELQGKVAGANIQANSGAPGGGMQVRLRGTTTVIGGVGPALRGRRRHHQQRRHGVGRQLDHQGVGRPAASRRTKTTHRTGSRTWTPTTSRPSKS